MNLQGHIGDRIRAFRVSAGISLAELARRLRTHPSNIQRWEQGKVSPNWKSLTRVAEALGVAVEVLVSGSGPAGHGERPEPGSAKADSDEMLMSTRLLESIDSMDSELSYSMDSGRLSEEPREASEERAQPGRDILRRLQFDWRLRELREALGELPEDLTEQEAMQIAEIIRAYVRSRG